MASIAWMAGMTAISAVSGVTIGGQVGAVAAPSGLAKPMIETGVDPILVDPVLLKALRVAGIEACNPGTRRLTGEQFEHLISAVERPVHERIQIRSLVFQAGIQPADARA